jgi:hypothetical protein
MAHDFADRAVAQQRNTDDEPQDVVCAPLAAWIVAGARRLQCMRNPLRIMRFDEECDAWPAVFAPLVYLFPRCLPSRSVTRAQAASTRLASSSDIDSMYDPTLAGSIAFP